MTENTMKKTAIDQAIIELTARVDAAIATADTLRGEDPVRVAHADSLLSALYMMRGHAKDYLLEGILPDEAWPPPQWQMETWSAQWKKFFDQCQAVPAFIATYAKNNPPRQP